MNQIIDLINETARQLAKVPKDHHERQQQLHDEMWTYLRVLGQIAVMQADKEYKSEHN